MLYLREATTCMREKKERFEKIKTHTSNAGDENSSE